MENKSYRAVVDKVVEEGEHGPYAFARCEELGKDITFSLDSSVWHEADRPEPGMWVVLSDLRKKRNRKKRDEWRAMNGRFLQPSDEQQS